MCARVRAPGARWCLPRRVAPARPPVRRVARSAAPRPRAVAGTPEDRRARPLVTPGRRRRDLCPMSDIERTVRRAPGGRIGPDLPAWAHWWTGAAARPWTVGVEEEAMLLDAGTGALANRIG